MEGVDLIHLAHDRYQDKRVKPGNLPTTSGRVFTFFTNSLSRVTEATTAATAFTAPVQLIPFL